jgi:hypothetical protein
VKPVIEACPLESIQDGSPRRTLVTLPVLEFIRRYFFEMLQVSIRLESVI